MLDAKSRQRELTPTMRSSPSTEFPRPHLLLLAPLREAHTSLYRLLNAKYDLSILESCDELVSAIMEGSPVAAIVTDIWDSRGQPVAAVVKTTRRAFPSIPIIVCCRLVPGAAAEILELARAGINALVLRGFDDVGATISSLITNATADCGTGFILSAIRPYLRECELPIVEYCVTHGARKFSVLELARALSLSRRTLTYRLSAGCLHSVHSLIVWCRLLVAARLLQDRGRTVESIALSLHFGSAAALRNMLRRQAGLSPVELRVLGGQQFLLTAYIHRLEERSLGRRSLARSDRMRAPGSATRRTRRSNTAVAAE